MSRMNEIKQHRPAFFDGFENETVPFDTLEELMAIPWVVSFALAAEFHGFSVYDNHALIAEYRGGERWWVVGFLKNPVDGLPKLVITE